MVNLSEFNTIFFRPDQGFGRLNIQLRYKKKCSQSSQKSCIFFASLRLRIYRLIETSSFIFQSIWRNRYKLTEINLTLKIDSENFISLFMARGG